MNRDSEQLSSIFWTKYISHFTETRNIELYPAKRYSFSFRMNVDKRQKLFLVVLALSCALGALWIQHQSQSGLEGLRAEAHLQNQLVGEVIPFEVLLIKADQAQMKAELRKSVVLERVENQPTVVHVSAAIDSPEQAETAIREVQTALTAISKEFAAAEVRETAKNIRKIEQPDSGTAAAPKAQLTPPRKRPLSDEENQTGFRLRMEREDLEQYLNGGAEPSWLTSRLDKKLYRRPERELEEAQADLRTLKRTFKPQSKSVKAQEAEVARLSKVLKQNKQHLAKALLESHKAELAQLEDKALSRIKENIKLSKPEPAKIKSKGKSGSEQWSKNVAEELEAEQKILEDSAQFHLVSDVKVTHYDKEHYWIRMALWLGAAVFLLMGLFKPESALTEDPKPHSFQKLNRPTNLSLAAVPPPSPKSRLTAEPLLAQLVESVRNQDGSRARRFLVLGTSATDARPVVTVRLAKTLSAMGEDVRLVDFDLKGKLLSSKLGNFDTAGVADLLTSHNVPIDEFFAPLSGTSIEFAPAGNSSVRELTPQATEGLKSLLRPRKNGILVVDASFDSPVKALLDHVEAVICVTSVDNKWNQQQQQVLLEIKDAQKPIWGLIQGDKGLYPFA